jgi:signal transduction histidine kinase
MINVGLYTLFNLFVVYLGFTLESEKKARMKASQLVAELRATQQLLASASKRDERLRIARELHDLSGHHLSALSLQLEVARHSDGEKHQHAIERAGFIAHLLLSELRQTVSDFRQQRSLDMGSALRALIERLPRPQVWLSLPASLHIDDVAMAETVLRLVQEALTNMVRHSDAERACIVLQQQDQQLTICIEDCGGEQTSTFPAAVTPGNGLSGMQERIAARGGELTIRQGYFGFRLDVRLPLGSGLIV